MTTHESMFQTCVHATLMNMVEEQHAPVSASAVAARLGCGMRRVWRYLSRLAMAGTIQHDAAFSRFWTGDIDGE
jgi:DNA-binding IclR family transcriptional regulator